MNKWFIASIITLLIFWWLIHPTPCDNEVEGFYGGFGPNQWGLRSRIHVTLDDKGEPINWDYQSPTMNGELGCTQVSCGDKLADDIVCWRCCNYH